MKLFPNTLYIVSTPIGNLDDITLRAIQVLKNSDIILCEDTRRSLKLLNHLKIKKQLISYHKFNEKKQTYTAIEHIKKGKILSIISDAGTPMLSDPGQLLLRECISKKVRVVPVPGVSSITTAMSVSGFDHKFLFYGFLPKKENEIEKILKTLSIIKFSLVFFIPSIKVNLYLKKFKKFFPERKLLIAREMTKIYEEFLRDDIKKFTTFKESLKGEITLVVSEHEIKEKSVNKQKIINKAKKYLKRYGVKDTVDLILETEKLNKKEIYRLCLEIKKSEIY